MGSREDYYLAPLFPTLFVIGAVALAPLLRSRTGKTAVGIGVVAATAFATLAAPMALPILPPTMLAAYIRKIGIAPQQQERSFRGTVLPQAFADQLGWHDFVRQVEAAWAQVPGSIRAATVIKVDNYGEAPRSSCMGPVCRR